MHAACSRLFYRLNPLPFPVDPYVKFSLQLGQSVCRFAPQQWNTTMTALLDHHRRRRRRRSPGCWLAAAWIASIVGAGAADTLQSSTAGATIATSGGVTKNNKRKRSFTRRRAAAPSDQFTPSFLSVPFQPVYPEYSKPLLPITRHQTQPLIEGSTTTKTAATPAAAAAAFQNNNTFQSNAIPKQVTTYKMALRRTQEQPQHPESRSILVIRILTQPEDAATTATMQQTLQSVLYDGQDQQPSVRAQMLSCSAGRVHLQPAAPQGFLTVSVSGISSTSHVDWVESAAASLIPQHYPQLSSESSTSTSSFTALLRTVADHVVVILPSDYPDASFLATAEIDASLSMYSIPWATSLSAYMHELAHNMGLRHARSIQSPSLETDEYGDTTGYMGRSAPMAWVPQKCYNPAQHWTLGWYDDDRRLSLASSSAATTATSPKEVRLAAFVDYDKLAPDDGFVVLIELNDGATYLQFNRAKSFNIGTDMMIDQVTVVKGESDHTVLLAGLDDTANPIYEEPNSGVYVRVCRLVMADDDTMAVDYAILAVGPGAVCTESAAVEPEPSTPQADETVASPFDDDAVSASDNSPAPTTAAPIALSITPTTRQPVTMPFAGTAAGTLVPTFFPTATPTATASSTMSPILESKETFATNAPVVTSVPVSTPPTARVNVLLEPTRSPTESWSNSLSPNARPVLQPTVIDTNNVPTITEAKPNAQNEDGTSGIINSSPPAVTPPFGAGATRDSSSSSSNEKRRTRILYGTLLGGGALVILGVALSYFVFRRWKSDQDPDSFWQRLSRSKKHDKSFDTTGSGDRKDRVTIKTSVMSSPLASSLSTLPMFRCSTGSTSGQGSRSSESHDKDGAASVSSWKLAAPQAAMDEPPLYDTATNKSRHEQSRNIKNHDAWSPAWAEIEEDEDSAVLNTTAVTQDMAREEWKQRVDDILHSIGWVVQEKNNSFSVSESVTGFQTEPHVASSSLELNDCSLEPNEC